MPDIERTLGDHAAQLKNMGDDITEIKSDVKQLLAVKNQFEGAKKTMLALATALGAAGGAIASYLR